MSSTPTAARPVERRDAHWYFPDSTPCHQVEKKGEPGAFRPTTLADARKLNLLPSVTTILKVLDKPGLNCWKMEQVGLAIATSPRLPGEKDDEFVKRVIQVEEQHEQEAQIARDRGIEIHEELDAYFSGKWVPTKWTGPAIAAIEKFGKPAYTELVVVGDGYAGRVDLILDSPLCWWIVDYKATKNLPRQGAWEEHVLQAASYAKAFMNSFDTGGKTIRTANVYISTETPGDFVFCEHTSYFDNTYHNGFAPLVKFWQWSKGYKPNGH